MSETCNEFFEKEKCLKRLKNLNCPSRDGLCCSKFMYPLRPSIRQEGDVSLQKTEIKGEQIMKTQESNVASVVAVENRICAGKHGMCGYVITPTMKSCPVCGSHNFKELNVDNGSACFLASVALATENPDFRGFGPGHDFKAQAS